MSDMVSTFDLLSSDPTGLGLKQLQDELFDMRSLVKKSMDAGLNTEDMSVARRALDAVEAADQAASKLYDTWNR